MKDYDIFQSLCLHLQLKNRVLIFFKTKQNAVVGNKNELKICENGNIPFPATLLERRGLTVGFETPPVQSTESRRLRRHRSERLLRLLDSLLRPFALRTPRRWSTCWSPSSLSACSADLIDHRPRKLRLPRVSSSCAAFPSFPLSAKPQLLAAPIIVRLSANCSRHRLFAHLFFCLDRLNSLTASATLLASPSPR